MYVGDQIRLGQDGLQCRWYVSTTANPGETFVSDSPILQIDQARLEYTGLYKCYANGVLTLNCQVNVVYSWGKYRLSVLYVHVNCLCL